MPVVTFATVDNAAADRFMAYSEVCMFMHGEVFNGMREGCCRRRETQKAHFELTGPKVAQKSIAFLKDAFGTLNDSPGFPLYVAARIVFAQMKTTMSFLFNHLSGFFRSSRESHFDFFPRVGRIRNMEGNEISSRASANVVLSV